MTTSPKLQELASASLKAQLKFKAAEQKAAQLKRDFDALQEQLIEQLREEKIESVRVKGFNFTVGKRDILETTDWDAFWAWARKDRLGVYVQKRPAVKAIREQLDDGAAVPGVKPGTQPVLHITKAKAG